MCAHNGTHIDAPFHFIKGGKTVDSIGLDTFVGMAYVAEYCGIVSGTAAAEILEKAKKQNPEAAMRILIKGDAEVSSRQRKYLPTRGSYCSATNPRLSGPKLLQWRYISSCWGPVSYCLKESVWQKFRKAVIS